MASYRSSASSSPSHLGDSNGSRLRPTPVDIYLRTKRVNDVLAILNQNNLIVGLHALAGEIQQGQLTQATSDHHFTPLQTFLDAYCPEIEQGNLQRSGVLVEMIVTHERFREQFLDLSPDGQRAYAVANCGTDIGKLAYPRPTWTDNARYRHGQNPLVDHPEIGAQVLERLGFPEENPLAEQHRGKKHPQYFDGTCIVAGVRWHHAKYDGSGYPEPRKHREIPLVARVIKPADSAEAMRSRKAERFPTPESVIAELRCCRRKDFDPGIVDIVCELIPAWWEAAPLPTQRLQIP